MTINLECWTISLLSFSQTGEPPPIFTPDGLIPFCYLLQINPLSQQIFIQVSSFILNPAKFQCLVVPAPTFQEMLLISNLKSPYIFLVSQFKMLSMLHY